MTGTPEVEIYDDVDHRRYEATLEGRLGGFLTYRRSADRMTLIHTEVDPQLEGHGIGGRLARHAFDAARRDGLRVTVQCPFVTTWLRRHKEYQDIVDRAVRDRSSS
jgi:predicted GNAT family acetyltransferase